ncbi:hypothetical protein L7F22_042279 [Adiantum nelumboides]|nr:hypothetical protein [Adiantum nelumboides]
MSSSKDKIQGKRYDSSSEIFLGPESKKLRLSELKNHAIFAQCQEIPTYSHPLTDVQEESLAKRCSVYDLQKKVKDTIDDKRLATELRTRLLTWVAEGAPEHGETFRHKRKGRQDESTTNETENDPIDSAESISPLEGEPIVQHLAVSDLLSKIQSKVPNAFKFMANPALASAYHQQGGRLDGSAIMAPTPTSSLIRTDSTSVIESVNEKQTTAAKECQPLILQISIYSRPPRGMWAKEKFDRIVRSVPKSDVRLDDEEEDFEDELPWQEGDKYEIPEKIKRGPQSIFGRTGPYESLQLTQKIEIRSDATLKDLRDGFYCRMDDILQSKDEAEKFKVWNKQVAIGELSSTAPQMHQYINQKRKTDSCFLIEDTLYSADSGKDSYAHLLSTHFAKPDEDGAPSRAAASRQSMAEVRLEALELCTGRLYWLLHEGSCEHIWTIDSVRIAQEEEESKRTKSESNTTFLRNGFAVSPILRWSRPVKKVESFSFGSCQICEEVPSDMIIIGGERFRPSNGKETCNGLKEDNVGVCENCWYTLNGDNMEFSGAGGEGWIVIPLM